MERICSFCGKPFQSDDYGRRICFAHTDIEHTVSLKDEQHSLNSLKGRIKTHKLEVKLPDLVKSVDTTLNRKILEIGLDQFDIPYEENLTLDNKVFDIFIPDRKIVISINPTKSNNLYSLDYEKLHRVKSTIARNHGLRCIHVFDWDDPEKIMLLLQPKTILKAEDCKVEEIDDVSYKIFCTMFHLTGSGNAKIKYGLFYQDHLVAVMGFNKSRFVKKYEWEIGRTCIDSQYKIVGGIALLLDTFRLRYKPKSFVAYSDKSKFTGNDFRLYGMKEDSVSKQCNVIWSKGYESISNHMLHTRSYYGIFEVPGVQTQSNEQCMLDNGWLPVHDCGTYRFVWEYDKSL